MVDDSQERAYRQPYHHFVDLETGETASVLSWGLEYYAYATAVIGRVRRAAPALCADVGCGDGKMLLELSRRMPRSRFEGFDTSAHAIAFAQAFAHGQPNLRFFPHPFAAARKRYDIILCTEVLEHVPDEQVEPFLRAIAARLKKDGRLFLTVPTTNIPLHHKHYRHYTLELLEQQFGIQLEIVDFAYFCRATLPSRLLRLTLINRLFVLRRSWLQRLLLRAYLRLYAVADARTGRHIFVEAKARPRRERT